MPSKTAQAVVCIVHPKEEVMQAVTGPTLGAYGDEAGVERKGRGRPRDV